MLILNYPSKKELKQQVGKPLLYTETSIFGLEYQPDGKFAGCNRPHLTGFKREFFASVTMKGGLIAKVT